MAGSSKVAARALKALSEHSSAHGLALRLPPYLVGEHPTSRSIFLWKGNAVPESPLLVIVRSNSEKDLEELRDYMASLNSPIGPVSRETLTPGVNLDPELVYESAFKVLAPIPVSLVPNLVQRVVTNAKRIPNASASAVIEVKGDRIIVSGDSLPELILATVNAAIGH
jgi:hypothetical protein